MSQTDQAPAVIPRPRYNIKDHVQVLPPEARALKFPDDEDMESPLHGLLLVCGIDRMADGEPDRIVYVLGEDMLATVKYIVPESCIDC